MKRWHKDGVAAAVRSPGADTRSRKERSSGGDGVLGHALVREDETGMKGGHTGDRAPFIGNTAGSGGRPMGGAT
jgi:hypothetical protein